MVVCRWESVSEVSRKVLAARYRLMPFLYSAFYDSHTYGCPVARPLFFAFPSDNNTRAISDQWMMGAFTSSCCANEAEFRPFTCIHSAQLPQRWGMELLGESQKEHIVHKPTLR